MKRIRVDIETPTGGPYVEFFDVDDDASDEDIAAEAADVFGNYCNYGWSEADPEDPDDDC